MSYKHLTLENLPQVWEYLKETRGCADIVMVVELSCGNKSAVQIDEFANMIKARMNNLDNSAGKIIINAAMEVECVCGESHLISLNDLVEQLNDYCNMHSPQ